MLLQCNMLEPDMALHCAHEGKLILTLTVSNSIYGPHVESCEPQLSDIIIQHNGGILIK